MPNLTPTRPAQHAAPLHPLSNWRGGRGVRFAVLGALALALLMLSFAAGAGPVQAQGWTCTYDFSVNNGGFAVANINHEVHTAGNYSGGVWTTGTANYNFPPRYYTRTLSISRSFTSATVTDVTVNYAYSAGSYTGTFTKFQVKLGGTSLVQIQTSDGPVPDSPYEWSGSNSASSVGVVITTSSSTDGSYSGSASISSITLQGTGTNPCAPAVTPTPSLTPTPVTPTPTATATPAPSSVTYNFLSAPGPFVSDNADTEWVPGTGWQATDWYPLDSNGWHMWYAGIKTCLASPGALGITAWEMVIAEIEPGPSPNFMSNRVVSSRDGSNSTNTPFTTAKTDFAESVPWSYGQTITFGVFNANPGNYFGGSEPITAWNNWADDQTWAIESLKLYYSGSLPDWDCGAPPPPTVTLTCPTGDMSTNITYTFEAETTSVVTSWAWDFGDGNTSSEADGDVEFSWPLNGTYTVEVEVVGPGGIDSDSCVITILRVGDPGGGGGALYRPLRTIDSDTSLVWPNAPLGLFSAAAAWGGDQLRDFSIPNLNYQGPDDETVIGVSNIYDANVYAVADGTVLDVQPLPVGACDPLDIDNHGGNECSFGLYGDVPEGNFIRFGQMDVNPYGLYKVTMSYVTGVVMEYYVANAPLYVRQGQVLLAGCIVGNTTPYTFSSVRPTYDVQFPQPERATASMFWMQAVQVSGGAQVPVLAQMFIEPNAATACNAGGDYANCLFDPMFQNQGAYTWTEQGRVNWADGVTLSPGASISLQGLTLDAATAYSFTVWTQRPVNYGPTDARITLGIGTTETSFFLSEGIRTPWAIASATHPPDQGGLYSLRITNSGRAPFTVLQNCLTAGAPNTAPGSCYFQNYTFDGQLSGWSTTGTVIPDPSGPLNGQIAVMSDLATLGQNVKLYADGGGGDHTYTVTLEGVLHGTGTSFFQVRYRFGGGGWVTPSVTGWNVSEQSLNASQRTKMISFDVPSGTFAGVMEFQFDFTATGGDVIGDTLWLSVYSLCLGDEAGFGHHPGGDGSNWTPGMGCDNSAPPVELQDDFGAWISYHLNGMEDIYYCDVIPQLERLNNITYSIYEYGQWTGLYSQAVQSNVSAWADKSLFPWLGGHLSNIARAAGGAIGVDVGGGCHDLFCLLDSLITKAVGPIIQIVGRIVDTILGLINTAVDVLLPLVQAIVGFFVQIIGALGGLLNSLITAITAFVTGIANAQPAPVPGLPNCAIDPSSNALCAVMYGLEQTVFADEGAAIIPLFIGLLAIVQLQWLIGKLGELIERVTGGI